jgi:hypothetical protein
VGHDPPVVDDGYLVGELIGLVEVLGGEQHVGAVGDNKSLRALMTGPLGAAYTTNQASYDLGRLVRNGLITRVPHRNLYTPHPRRPEVRDLLTKVHDRLLRPLLAVGQPPAPPVIGAALRISEVLGGRPAPYAPWRAGLQARPVPRSSCEASPGRGGARSAGGCG